MKISILVTLLFVISACGVKGDPLPPERPVDLGRGRPTYRRATEGLKVERSRPQADNQDESEEKDEDNEN